MIVLDASVWVSAILPRDANYSISEQWLAGWTGAGNKIAVPTLFLSEVSGAVARRTSIPALGLKAIADVLSEPAIDFMDIDRSLAEEASLIAANRLIRGPDALYVALAARLGVSLVTWDQEQLNRTSGLIQVTIPTV